MKKHCFALLAVVATLSANLASATDVAINMNGFLAGNGLYVAGPSYASSFIFSTPGPTYTALGLTNPGVYSVDFFHNSGTGSSDFSFNFDGTNITSVNPNDQGDTMVSSFTGSSLTMNTNTIVYNAGGGPSNYYAVNGATPAIFTGAAQNVTVIPGRYSIDNLYNTGGPGNEDYGIYVDDTGTVSAAPGNGGGNVTFAIPNSEYADFSGNQVMPRGELVHYIVDSSTTGVNIIAYFPMLNATGLGTTHAEFDMYLPIGSSGFNIESFGDNTLTTANYKHFDGTNPSGTFSTNDFNFVPKLRFDGTTNLNGFYWGGLGENSIATALVTGFFNDDATPLTVSIQAIIPDTPVELSLVPEPTTLALFGIGAFGLIATARRRR